MSLVYIKYHEENVSEIETRLSPKHQQEEWQMGGGDGSQMVMKIRKARRIRGKPNLTRGIDGKIWLNSSPKFEHKTMGVAPQPKHTEPCNFLRKRQGVKWQRQADHQCPKGGTMPPVPAFERRTTEAKSSKTNFIERNIERMKGKAAKKPTPHYIDTPKGDRHELINSGIVPQHICSNRFGRVPAYLTIHKKRLEELRKFCEPQAMGKNLELNCMALVGADMRTMTDEERKDILIGLKTNFTEMTRIYQSMSLYTDTAAKMLRKSNVEKELFELENDIKLLECHDVIYISEF